MVKKGDAKKKFENFKKSTLTPATKSAFALTATGVAYATAYTAAKGLAGATPINAEKVDNYFRYTDQGLLLQTAAMIGSTGLAIRFLESEVGGILVPNFFSQFKPEKKIMYSAVSGLAVGRLLTGLGGRGVGQRFQALFDGNLPAALYKTPGPYLNRPSNIRELDTVITRPTANSPPMISSDYYSAVYQPKLETQLAQLSNAN